MPLDLTEIVAGILGLVSSGSLLALYKAKHDAKRADRQDTMSGEEKLRTELMGILKTEREQYEKELEEVRAEVHQLRNRLEAQSRWITKLITERERLRLIINHHEDRAGIARTVWAQDEELV